MMINGVGVLDIPRSFTSDKWTRIGWNGGWVDVYQAREHMNRRGSGGRGGGHDCVR